MCQLAVLGRIDPEILVSLNVISILNNCELQTVLIRVLSFNVGLQGEKGERGSPGNGIRGQRGSTGPPGKCYFFVSFSFLRF